MKMKDLTRRTGVTKESIHYYAREGMLPSVIKPRPNQAEYTEEHVERILLIKKLQEMHFLPIPLIKEMMLDRQGELRDEELFEIKSNYFGAADHLLPKEIEGEAAFLEFTGVSAERLIDFEAQGIITYEIKDGVKVFSHDAVKLGRLIGDMRRRRLGYENGFGRNSLKEARDMLLPLVKKMQEEFERVIAERNFPVEEVQQLARTTAELVPLFYYHMSRILMRQMLANYMKDDIGS